MAAFGCVCVYTYLCVCVCVRVCACVCGSMSVYVCTYMTAHANNGLSNEEFTGESSTVSNHGDFHITGQYSTMAHTHVHTLHTIITTFPRKQSTNNCLEDIIDFSH